MKLIEIRIEGILDSKWAEWFEGFELTYTETGDTLLIGRFSDQAALYGIFAKLRDLSLNLLSVKYDVSGDINTNEGIPSAKQ